MDSPGFSCSGVKLKPGGGTWKGESKIVAQLGNALPRQSPPRSITCEPYIDNLRCAMVPEIM